MKLQLHSNDSHSYSEFYNEFNEVIKAFFSSVIKIDIVEYEGGLDRWFGPSSPMINELGLTLSLEYSDSGTVLTISN